MTAPGSERREDAERPLSKLAVAAGLLGWFACPCVTWPALEKLGLLGGHPNATNFALLALPLGPAVLATIAAVHMRSSTPRPSGAAFIAMAYCLSGLWLTLSVAALSIGGWGPSKG